MADTEAPLIVPVDQLPPSGDPQSQQETDRLVPVSTVESERQDDGSLLITIPARTLFTLACFGACFVYVLLGVIILFLVWNVEQFVAEPDMVAAVFGGFWLVMGILLLVTAIHTRMLELSVKVSEDNLTFYSSSPLRKTKWEFSKRHIFDVQLAARSAEGVLFLAVVLDDAQVYEFLSNCRGDEVEYIVRMVRNELGMTDAEETV